MLSFRGKNSSTNCSGITRRDFLRIGALSAVGLTLPDLLRMEAAQASALSGLNGKNRAKNVLCVFLGGGITHHDTFDPKPTAPEEIRGKYGVISTKLAGIQYTDPVPELAKLNDMYALVRSQATGSDHHETATQWVLTGNYGVMQGGDHPSIGSIVTHETKPLNTLPPYVAIPRNASFTWELGKSAFLGETCESFKTGDPSNKDWKVTNLSLQPDVDVERLNRRKSLLESVDTLAKRVEGSADLASMDTFYQRATQMVLSSEARNAFDLSKESEKTKEMYGTKGRFGMQCLLARRLVEANVRFVFLNLAGWDHHAKIFESCDRDLIPFDKAMAALLRDMRDRGLLDETLVAIFGEFGRTSKINKDAGRDHWGHAGSMIFAGAGVQGGQVIGTTDERGEYVLDRQVKPPEVAATIYDALGVNYQKELVTPQGRPVPILPDTEPIKELYT
ncbi:MAG: DUF1501 domain-containing protein [Armatimonadetes bacterium]|nr:DUF1501 domain-containing protein [Armatimonadota bacterium]